MNSERSGQAAVGPARVAQGAQVSASATGPASDGSATTLGAQAPSNRKGEIELRDVSVWYRKSATSEMVHAVSDVNIRIQPGRFVSLVGPSGCGKTSLMMVLAGLVPLTSGSATIGGEPVTGPRPRSTGIVFQDPSLLPWRTALDNVALPLEVAKVNKKERTERARQVLDLVGLSRNWQSYPNELSGGMRQRVALARGLVTNPDVLLMDEPFAALDEQSRDEMGAELLRVWERLNTTVVFITHSLSEAIFLSDEVIALTGSAPGRAGDHIEIPFSRPRDLSLMARPDFAEIRGRLYAALRPAAQVPGGGAGADGARPS
ncbi:ABC transporter ATP-binding protein [Dactylosporangium sp. NPDC051485]|uniref:ABC transporter ATP-binding protein n=1 Tax=Dactylosporangium sp. NPDC051485 TaxID=3154846 RepID=UPI0034400D3A